MRIGKNKNTQCAYLRSIKQNSDISIIIEKAVIAISKENFSLDEILRLAKAAEGLKSKNPIEAVQDKLPDDKMKELKKVLADKKALEQLLNSEQAQQLMKQFKNVK